MIERRGGRKKTYSHSLSLRSISSHRRTSLTNFRWKTLTSGLSCRGTRQSREVSKTRVSLVTRHLILLSRFHIGRFNAKSKANSVCCGHIVWLLLCLDRREEAQIFASFLSIWHERSQTLAAAGRRNISHCSNEKVHLAS